MKTTESVSSDKIALLGKTSDELKSIVESLGMPSYTAAQLAQRLYGSKVFSIDDITEISKINREKLKEKYVTGRRLPSASQRSIDGTTKYLFQTDNGKFIETVCIPEKERTTICISTQIGCKMNCSFCMTGKQGFSGNLSSAEILNQILSAPEAQQLTNFVFMGMGEPFDNYQNLMSVLEIMTAPYGFALSPKRITVSTVGILPRLKQFLDKSRCHLAISIHSPFPEERLSMMPSEKAFPIKKILELLRQYDFSGQRRLSFEYIIFEGKNDGFEHAKELARLLKGMECRVNLIKFHSGDSRAVRWDSRLRGNDNTSYCHPREGGDPSGSITAFRDFLNAKGIIATIRASRGEDISAACGLLSGQHNSANN